MPEEISETVCGRGAAVGPSSSIGAALAQTVILKLDELIVLETPPLYSCYARCGEQISIPIGGGHARRIVHGAINIGTGDMPLLITPQWNRFTPQDFLHVIRAHWRGWHNSLFEDRGSPHAVADSRQHAEQLGSQIRRLPRATPELNAISSNRLLAFGACGILRSLSRGLT